MILTTADTDNVKDVLQALPNFQFFAHHVYSVATKTEEPGENLLTLRQKEILQWAAVGKTSWEIGHIISVSEATINFHLQRSAEKLGVKGRQAACAKALCLGLITL